MAAQQSFALPLPDDVTPIAPTQVLAHSPFTALTICPAPKLKSIPILCVLRTSTGYIYRITIYIAQCSAPDPYND